MKKVITFFLFVLPVAMVSAQNISNVDFHQVGDEIVITYDLDETSPIGAYVSLDGGKSYKEMHSVRGDIGRAVSLGKKRMLWKVLNDIPEGLSGQVQFKVSANLFVSIDDIEFEMVYVKGGTFMMGRTSEQTPTLLDTLLVKDASKPVHTVTLSDYYVGKYEVTQDLWEKVMGTTIVQQYDKLVDKTYTPLGSVGSNYPICHVTWIEASDFCAKLCQLTGKTFVLPTEAQWEYAARGGRKSKGVKYIGNNDIDKVTWYRNNSGKATHSVGTKQPNELGIYDMGGNIWEWCQDWYGYYGSEAQTNPTGPETGSFRMNRGGSFYSWEGDCQASPRRLKAPSFRDGDLGFRVVLLP